MRPSHRYSFSQRILRVPLIGFVRSSCSCVCLPFLSCPVLFVCAVQIDPYVLPAPQHVTLNHLYVYGYGKTPGESELLVTGITQRFKTKSFAHSQPKFVTTVYYSPKPVVAA
jgi:hypothetical protein